jgi:hypothetical protein
VGDGSLPAATLVIVTGSPLPPSVGGEYVSNTLSSHASHWTDFASVSVATLSPLHDQLVLSLREDRDPQAWSLPENVHDRKDNHRQHSREKRVARCGPLHGARRAVAAATIGHYRARRAT